MWGPREAGASGGSYKKARSCRADDTQPFRLGASATSRWGPGTTPDAALVVLSAESAAQHTLIAAANQPAR